MLYRNGIHYNIVNRNAFPLGEGVRGPDRGRMREKYPQVAGTGPAGQARPSSAACGGRKFPRGKPLGRILYALPHFNKNWQFNRVYGRGKSYVHPHCVLYVAKNRLGYTRIGLTATKKVGHAVQRNRARRIMRAALSEHLAQNIGGMTSFWSPAARPPRLKSSPAEQNARPAVCKGRSARQAARPRARDAHSNDRPPSHRAFARL